MQIADFPSCCGARIIHDFFNGDLNATRLNVLIKEIKSSRAGIVIAITSSREGRQQKAAELLEAKGFKKVIHNTNPNTDRKTLLWVLDLTQKPKKTPPARISRPSRD